MKKNTFLALATLVAIFATVGTAMAAEGVVSSAVPQEMAVAAEAYWTPERMAAAIPYSVALPGSPTDVSAADLERETPGPPGSATSSATGRPSQLLGSTEATPTSDIGPASSSYPFPHTTYKVLRSSYTTFPYRAVGKVFFTKVSGGNYVCSGSSVGGRLVLTAGHCVAEGGQKQWHTNWVFVPAYRGWYTSTPSQRPYGTWSAKKLITFTAWFNEGRWCRDVGFVVTNDVAGVKLSSKVGSLGFSWNQTRNKQHWDAFGYPSASPWDGKEMVQTEAEWARDDNPGCTPYTVGIGTSQTPGCSGGPWIRVFYPDRSGANNYANGVFSYYYTAQPKGMYSPYFDTAVHDVWATYITY
ncbi:MAG: trypsin-like serine protease [Desulfosoma sp.]